MWLDILEFIFITSTIQSSSSSMCIATGTATGTVETADTAGADIDNTVINDGRTDAEFSGNVKSAAVDGCYVERYASGSGFHRDLLTVINVTMPTTANYEQPCRLVLVEMLPNGLYIDLDQIAMQSQLNGIQMYSADTIDIEKPAYLSRKHLVYVYSEEVLLSGHVSVRLQYPIHLRYHRPLTGEHIATVTLPPPKVLLHCLVIDIGSRKSDLVPCDNTEDSATCHRHKLKCLSGQATADIRLQVPVGKLEHLTLVIIGTVLSSVTAATFVCYSIFMTADHKPRKSS